MWWRFVVPEMAEPNNVIQFPAQGTKEPPEWVCSKCLHEFFHYQDGGTVICDNCKAAFPPALLSPVS